MNYSSGCSLRTLERRIKEWGLQKKRQTLSDETLEALIRQYKAIVGEFYGERAISALLHADSHWAPRGKIREIIRILDPEGIELRYVLTPNTSNLHSRSV